MINKEDELIDEDDFIWEIDEEDEEEDDPKDSEESTLYQPKINAAPSIHRFQEMRLEKRLARLDITKNSEEDHRRVNRHSKKELEEQIKRDYIYMKGKNYMMIQPFLIMDEYPFKTKNSDSDVIRPDGKNVEEDLVLVIGRLAKFKSTEEFKGKPFIRGEIAYISGGNYDIGLLKPHFAVVIRKKFKVIKQHKIRIRELFDVVRNEMQNGKPVVVYKEFPRKIIG